MWHRGGYRRRHRGSWFFWLIATLFIFSLFGKTGGLPFVFPFMLFWIFGPLLWGIFGDGRRRPRRYRYKRPPANLPEATHQRRPAVASREKIDSKESKPVAVRPDINALGSHCRACGGPVNRTTVEWRGHTARCGYCGTRLDR